MGHDDNKDAINIARHGLPLSFFYTFDLAASLIVPAKTVKGEVRYAVITTKADVVYTAIVTKRDGSYRPISVRHASRKERRMIT